MEGANFTEPQGVEKDTFTEKLRLEYEKAVRIQSGEHAEVEQQQQEPADVGAAVDDSLKAQRRRRQRESMRDKKKDKRTDKAMAVQVSHGMLLEAEEMAYRLGEKEAEDMVTLNHVSSRFDLSNPGYSNLRGQASSSGFTHDELSIVGEFGSCLTPKQENWNNSIEKNIQDSVTHVKEWMTMSGADIPGTQSTYAEVNHLTERMWESLNLEKKKLQFARQVSLSLSFLIFVSSESSSNAVYTPLNELHKSFHAAI